MRIWIIATIFSAASLLMTTGVHLAAAAEGQDPQASELFDHLIPKDALRHLYNQALSTLQEYVDVEGKLPGKGSSQQQAGEFRLKLFPQGKSRSQEHMSAEGSFRRSPDTDQQEFTLRFKSSRTPQQPPLANDDVI